MSNVFRPAVFAHAGSGAHWPDSSCACQGGGLASGKGVAALSAEDAFTSAARSRVSGLYARLQDGLSMLPASFTRKTTERGAEIALNTWRKDLLSWKGWILAEKSSSRLSIEYVPFASIAEFAPSTLTSEKTSEECSILYSALTCVKRSSVTFRSLESPPRSESSPSSAPWIWTLPSPTKESRSPGRPSAVAF